jgi:hypothetical protein
MNATDKAAAQEEVVAPLSIIEEADGSIVVDGVEGSQESNDENLASDKAGDSQAGDTSANDGDGSGDDAGAGDSESSVAAEDDDHEDDTEAIRQAKRDRRRAKKQFQRQQQKEKDLKFNQLLRQNQDLLQRLQSVEQRTHGAELGRIDKAIEDQEVRINYAKMKIAEATKNQDGDAMTEAQDLLYEARRAHEALNNLKKQAAASSPRAASAGPDKGMQRLAAAWMERRPWYDPNEGDEDSAIALAVDRRMAKEGWDPKTPEYWEELDSRLQKRLPHHYTEDEDGNSHRRTEGARQSRPRSVVTGSGRESSSSSGKKNRFILSAEHVKAIKDAGMWDDTQSRERMIRRYMNEAKNNTQRS